MTKSIAEHCQEIHAWAKSKGWHEAERPFAEWIALFHTEISEAYEEFRNHHNPDEIYHEYNVETDTLKPEGIPIEIADLAVRIFHFCAYYGIDLEAAMEQKMRYNQNRPYRHGGKKS